MSAPSAYFAPGGGIGVARLVAPRAWFGRTAGALRRTKPTPSGILAIQRGEETLAAPGRDEVIREGTILVMLCPDDTIDDIPTDHHADDTPVCLSGGRRAV